MDLAGIGAVAAAGVAAVGVPAALVVGRWQVRAALAQAEKTYQAALDAAHTTAVSTHAQWRRSTRRDACVELLLSVAAIEQWDPPLHVETDEEWKEAEAELVALRDRGRTAFHVVQLESSELGEAARGMMRAVAEVLRTAERMAASHRAMVLLRQHAQRESITFDDALSSLRRLDDFIEERRRGERSQAHDQALTQLEQNLTATGVLTPRLVRAVVNQLTSTVSRRLTRIDLELQRRPFLRAARMELDNPGSASVSEPPAA